MTPQKSRPLAPSVDLRCHGVRRILVAQVAGTATRGKLVLDSGAIPCVLGRTGITRRKREGDGATPAGRFRLLALWMRADRLPPLRAGLPRRFIRRDDGWCDDAAAPTYNRPLRLPSVRSHEDMWRPDGLYDLVLMLDYNLIHPRKGRGSAIFFHLAHDDWRATAGCVAIRPEAMRRLLPRLSLNTVMVVRPY